MRKISGMILKMKYLNLFHDTIETYPYILSAAFVAAKPWFPNSSFGGNLDPDVAESLTQLAENYELRPVDAINHLVASEGAEKYVGSLFLWCEGSGDDISLHSLSYSIQSLANNVGHPFEYAVTSGSLFSFQPEGGESREVKFMKGLMEKTWGDPTMYDIAISFAGSERGLRMRESRF